MSTECSRLVWNMRLQILLPFGGGGTSRPLGAFVAFIIQPPSAEISSAATVHNMGIGEESRNPVAITGRFSARHFSLYE